MPLDDSRIREQNAGTAYTKSPEKFVKHLEGIEYPANKEDLLSVARGNAAPPEVLRAIERLPQTSFDDVDQLRVAYESMK